ncbi:MAG: hypothetical protein AB8F95_08005 [Bacteroidia bacterium]
MLENLELSRARVSRTAIEKLYVEMRHLANRGRYRPNGRTGSVVREALINLSPEIYGSMNDPEKVELNGLVYVIDRLPRGIEECRIIRLVSEEGYQDSGLEVIVPSARRRNCYRIDAERMYIEVTRGRSEIYDILTHLSFLYIEAEKVMRHALNEKGKPTGEWLMLEKIVLGDGVEDDQDQIKAYNYLATVLGRTYEETRIACQRLSSNSKSNNGLFNVVYWMGKLAMGEHHREEMREVSFSPSLRARTGHHVYGERWATNIKKHLFDNDLLDRPLHIISANLHSVVNTLYAYPALREHFKPDIPVFDIAAKMSQKENKGLQEEVFRYAQAKGLTVLNNHSGTHISVQIIDTTELATCELHPEVAKHFSSADILSQKPVILVMDYAFGEQAYETLDELLKPYAPEGKKPMYMPVTSISIMGKAGILTGGKGDLMVPTAHVFEGTADNYPFKNDFSKDDFNDYEIPVLEGPMITVLGTSLQNRDILAYFKNSSWRAIGLEMEGAHYQKAIQSQTAIRKNVDPNLTLRYAYYASDNPLLTGSTLASGSLGETGIKPAYLITLKILEKIFSSVPKAASNGQSKKKRKKDSVS